MWCKAWFDLRAHLSVIFFEFQVSNDCLRCIVKLGLKLIAPGLVACDLDLVAKHLQPCIVTLLSMNLPAQHKLACKHQSTRVSIKFGDPGLQ